MYLDTLNSSDSMLRCAALTNTLRCLTDPGTRSVSKSRTRTGVSCFLRLQSGRPHERPSARHWIPLLELVQLS